LHNHYQVLADYLTDARRLSLDAFRERYGEAFLVYDGPIEQLRPVLRTKVASVATMFGDKTDPCVPVNKAQFAVFSVRGTGRSRFPDFVSVGRADNNDIVIEQESISRFHAFFRRTVDGFFVVQDGESKNGTQVNYVRVPTKNESEPVPVESGARVSFGLVQMTFFMAKEFCAFARQTT
jgi:hypothetical protein